MLVAALALVMSSACAQPSKKPGKVVVSDTETEILDRVSFTPGTAELEPRSLPILDAVGSTLQGNPGILLVEVQSHTEIAVWVRFVMPSWFHRRSAFPSPVMSATSRV